MKLHMLFLAATWACLCLGGRLPVAFLETAQRPIGKNRPMTGKSPSGTKVNISPLKSSHTAIQPAPPSPSCSMSPSRVSGEETISKTSPDTGGKGRDDKVKPKFPPFMTFPDMFRPHIPIFGSPSPSSTPSPLPRPSISAAPSATASVTPTSIESPSPSKSRTPSPTPTSSRSPKPSKSRRPRKPPAPRPPKPQVPTPSPSASSGIPCEVQFVTPDPMSLNAQCDCGSGSITVPLITDLDDPDYSDTKNCILVDSNIPCTEDVELFRETAFDAVVDCCSTGVLDADFGCVEGNRNQQ